jgi:hypothetical protein
MVDRPYPAAFQLVRCRVIPPDASGLRREELYVDEKGVAWVRLVDKEDPRNFLSITQHDFERRSR